MAKTGDGTNADKSDRSEGGRTVNMGGVSGGTTAFSLGDHSPVDQHSYTAPPGGLDELFALLRSRIEEHDDEVDDADAMRESADDLEEELSKDRPKPGIVRALLRDITANAGQVASLVDAVARIERAVGGMF